MNNKKLKSIVFSMVVAAGMLLPMGASAQNDVRQGGLFSTEDYDGTSNSRGLFGITLQAVDESDGIINLGIGQDEEDAPLGSGIAILIGAGLGYVALKKKEDEQ